MYFIKTISKRNKKTLSNIGLNINALSTPIDGKKNGYLVSEIEDVLLTIIDKIKSNEDDYVYDLCESILFKKETLLRPIWKWRNNVKPIILKDILNDEIKKSILVDRLNLIIFILRN